MDRLARRPGGPGVRAPSCFDPPDAAFDAAFSSGNSALATRTKASPWVPGRPGGARGLAHRHPRRPRHRRLLALVPRAAAALAGQGRPDRRRRAGSTRPRSTVTVNGHRYGFAELAGKGDEYWFTTDPAGAARAGRDRARPRAPGAAAARPVDPLHPHRPGPGAARRAQRDRQDPDRCGSLDMTDTAPGLPRLGTTLFSLSLEQRKPGRDFASLVAEVAARDLGPGLEMVAFQSLRGWPRLSDDAGPRGPRRHRRLRSDAVVPGDQQRPRPVPGPAAVRRRVLRVRRRPGTRRRRARLPGHPGRRRDRHRRSWSGCCRWPRSSASRSAWRSTRR